MRLSRSTFVLAIGFSFLLTPCQAFSAGPTYDFGLVDNGAVIASNGSDTAYPSVIRVPSWIAPTERADTAANYYMYYGNHSGSHIRMKWSETIDGPWTEFNLGGTFNGETRQGVYDIDADSTRDSFDHISAPDVHVDHNNQQIVMYYHGQNQHTTTTSGGTTARRRHESFVTISGTGLNFNDPLHAGGESGFGQVTVTVDDVTRDIWIGEDYQRAFEKDGDWYSVGKRAIINASPDPLDIWAPLAGDEFGESWTRENTPTSLWTNDADPGGQDDYHSPAATFLASSEFANHPNNPLPGERVFSNGNDERLNHVSVNPLSSDELEIFFYVREANSSAPDRYDDIYRVVLDTSDSDFQNWELARSLNGEVIFDVALTDEDLFAAVELANGTGFDGDLYADPVSLGDTGIFVDDDGSKYLFLSYVSDENGGAMGEGQITAVELLPRFESDYNLDGFVDVRDYDLWVSTYGETNDLRADGNSDGTVDAADYTIWRDGYEANLVAFVSSVPEPSSLILACLALLGCSRRRAIN